MIKLYGSRCNCPGCPVDQVALLCLDHVKNDGAVRRGSAHIDGWRRNNQQEVRIAGREHRPDIYQLLCGTCNLAKRLGVQCEWH
jgi:hypothetical protein